MMSDRFLTVREVCERYGISKDTVYKKVSLGLIPCIRVGRSIRFGIQDLEEWEQENKVKMQKAELL
jgi:excisionase family DNA binding protein